MQEDLYMQDLIDIGNAICQRREELNLSQEEVAEKADISWNTVHRTEHAKTSIRIDAFLRLCAALGITPNDCVPQRYIHTSYTSELTALFMQLSEDNKSFIISQTRNLMEHLLALQSRQ